VDLVDGVEAVGGVAGEQARQPGREAGADDDGPIALGGLVAGAASAAWVPLGVARMAASTPSTGWSGEPVQAVACEPRDLATAAHRSARVSDTTSSSTSSKPSSCRAARAPVAPTPITAMRIRVPGSREIGAGQLAPSAVLGRYAAGAPQSQHPGHQRGDPEGDQRTTQHPHGRAS
jgi:hypothetical protein